MTTQVPVFGSPALPRAYRSVSLTVARMPQPLESLPPAPAGPRRALVIDDDRVLAANLARQLRLSGLEVTICATDDDVLAVVFAGRPDVILVHASGDDERALDACRALREGDAAQVRAVIAYGTGDGEEDCVARALEAGADDYVADVRRGRELRARVAVQLRHLRDREVMHWAREQRSSLRELANTDPLTGLANRRAVSRALDHALAAGSPVILLILDLDHFKHINDAHGHPAGDLALRRVARAIEVVAPLAAQAGRWGGEEFAIVVPGAENDSPREIGERIRRAVADISLSEIDDALSLTVSVGVATWDGGSDAPSGPTLVAAADAELYRAKRAGRNRVCVSSGLEP
jgi:two-component system cell cycle response regulator